MTAPLQTVRAAAIPAGGLAALARVRGLPGIRVVRRDDRTWIFWDGADDAVLTCLLPVRGVRLFEPRDGAWYRAGEHLPAFDVPAGDPSEPLDRLIVPAPAVPEPPPAERPTPTRLRLVPCSRPRQATAVRCRLAALAEWADRATTRQLSAFRAAVAGGRVLVAGVGVPVLSGGERFWGEGLFVPLGRRPEPDWSAGALREALGIAHDELALVTDAGVEVIPATALGPLTRAGVRRAAAGEGGRVPAHE